jgi:hypothetical protein
VIIVIRYDSLSSFENVAVGGASIAAPATSEAPLARRSPARTRMKLREGIAHRYSPATKKPVGLNDERQVSVRTVSL